jgi:hypothetical protein
MGALSTRTSVRKPDQGISPGEGGAPVLDHQACVWFRQGPLSRAEEKYEQTVCRLRALQFFPLSSPTCDSLIRGGVCSKMRFPAQIRVKPDEKMTPLEKYARKDQL